MTATVKIALVSRTVFYAPVWVAEQNGYFRDEGVEPHFEIFDNAEKINEVMRSSEAQIATEAYARHAISDALNFKPMPDGLAASEPSMRRVFRARPSRAP